MFTIYKIRHGHILATTYNGVRVNEAMCCGNIANVNTNILFLKFKYYLLTPKKFIR